MQILRMEMESEGVRSLNDRLQNASAQINKNDSYLGKTF